MGCCFSRRREAVFEPRPEDFDEPTVTDILVTAAGEYVLAAASLSPLDSETLTNAFARFKLIYTVFTGTERFRTDAEAYLYARCVLNAHQAGVRYRDAPLSGIEDGVHRPFGDLEAPVRRVSV